MSEPHTLYESPMTGERITVDLPLEAPSGPGPHALRVDARHPSHD